VERWTGADGDASKGGELKPYKLIKRWHNGSVVGKCEILSGNSNHFQSQEISCSVFVFFIVVFQTLKLKITGLENQGKFTAGKRVKNMQH
jgi:hypothetical protein